MVRRENSIDNADQFAGDVGCTTQPVTIVATRADPNTRGILDLQLTDCVGIRRTI